MTRVMYVPVNDLLFWANNTVLPLFQQTQNDLIFKKNKHTIKINQFWGKKTIF